MVNRGFYVGIIGAAALVVAGAAGLAVRSASKKGSSPGGAVAEPTRPPDASALADASWPPRDAAPVDAAPENEDVEKKELELGDGAANQHSVRVLHPDLAVQKRLHDWLEPRERKAVANGSDLSCNADTATRGLVSIHCYSILNWQPEPDADPGAGGGSPNPEYEGLTLEITRTGIRELALKDVLAPGIGDKELKEACRKASDPPAECRWPPTAFWIEGETGLTICHEASCTNRSESMENLVRADLGGHVGK